MTFPTNPHFISFIVPAYNEEKLILSCLQSLRVSAQEVIPPDWEWEMIVVDNNCTDRTADLAAGAGARVVFEGINQIARARNAGAREARGDWFVFIDADSTLTPGLMADTVSAMTVADIVGGGAWVGFPDTPFWTVRVSVAFWNRLSSFKQWAAGSYVFCRADVFRALGGFSDQMYFAEEIEFSGRVGEWAAKEKMRFVILRKHRILTSDRKAHLYKVRDWLRLVWRFIQSPRRAVRGKDKPDIWYDGRR